jgi:glycosyltransferase A (GT-A) superfamily protein (DUF2064 family)
MGSPWGLSRSFFRGCKLSMLGVEIFNVCDQQSLLAQSSRYERLDAVLTFMEDGGWIIIGVLVCVMTTFGQRLRCCAKDGYSSRKRRHQA